MLVLGIGNSATRHRGRVLAGRRRDLPRDAPRRAHPAEVPVRRARPTTSPTHRWPAGRCGCSSSAWRRCCGSRQGRMTDYGLPEPDHDVLDAHPTVSDDLLDPARPRRHHREAEHRPLRGRQGVLRRRHRGRGRRRSSTAPATRSASRSSTRRVVRADDNHVDLYRRVVDPDHPGLYFIGLIQPLGAIMPLAEAQAAVGRRPGRRARARCRRATRCARRSRRTTRRCASGTSPRSGTRSRSTSTPTAASCAEERRTRRA